MAETGPRVNAAGTLFQFSVCFSTCAIVIAFFSKTSLHTIPEGYVGVYWRGGSLLPLVTAPGFRIRVPLIDTYAIVQVRRQTSRVAHISCITKSGVAIGLEAVEVTHKVEIDHVLTLVRNYGTDFLALLVDEKIRQEVSSWCNDLTLNEIFIGRFKELAVDLKRLLVESYASSLVGFSVLNVHVPPPILPNTMQEKLLAMEEQRMKAMMQQDELNVEKLGWKIEREREIAEANRSGEREMLELEHKLSRLKLEKEILELENELFLAKEKAAADAQLYRTQIEAEGNKVKLTPEYLKLAFINAVAANARSVPKSNITELAQDVSLIGQFAADGSD